MSTVVGEKANLDEEEGQIGSVEELEPKVVQDQQQSKARHQQSEGESKLGRIVGGLPVQQPSLLDESLQLSVSVGLYAWRRSSGEIGSRVLVQRIGW